MAVKQNDDGLLLYNIPVNFDNRDLYLPELQDYINSLNDFELADCPINRDGKFADSKIKGTFIKSGSDKFRMILGGEYNPIVYRGQVNDYPFMPSSHRYELFDGKERIRHCIDWVKKCEFKNLLLKTPYYTQTKLFSVLNRTYQINTEAIAKHYEFVSDYLDFTRNVLVALFFAYTYFDKDTNKFLPIEQYGYNTPYIYVGSLKDIYYNSPEALTNFGFQTMPRAMDQQSLSIDVSKNGELIKGLFRKIELPKNPVLSRNIYDKFDGGKFLFPHDNASKYAVKIKNQMTLNESLVEEYCEDTQTDEAWLKDELKNLGYVLISRSIEVSEEEDAFIRREVEEYMIPYLDSNFHCKSLKKSD